MTARDVGISAVINIKHCRLRALEQNFLARRNLFIEQSNRIADERANFFGVAFILAQNLVGIKRRVIVNFFQNQIFLRKNLRDFQSEFFTVNQITDANPDSVRLVNVAGTYAAFSRADFIFAAQIFAEFVKEFMPRHDDMSAIGKANARSIDAAPLHVVNFLKQTLRVDDNAVADNASRALVQNARRQKAQFIFLAVDRDGMTGI